MPRIVAPIDAVTDFSVVSETDTESKSRSKVKLKLGIESTDGEEDGPLVVLGTLRVDADGDDDEGNDEVKAEAEDGLRGVLLLLLLDPLKVSSHLFISNNLACTLGTSIILAASFSMTL